MKNERIFSLKFVDILKCVKIREFPEFLKFITYNFQCMDGAYRFAVIWTIPCLARSAKLPEGLYILPMFFRYFLARSAKVAERAICFTDRNFFF